MSTTAKKGDQNKDLIELLVNLDVAFTVGLLCFLIFIFTVEGLTTVVITLFIPGIFRLVFGRFRSYLGYDDDYVISGTVQNKIKTIVQFPKRTILFHHKKLDCKALSFYFFHIVFLPTDFQKKLKNRTSRAQLWHEVGHLKYADSFLFSSATIGVSVFSIGPVLRFLESTTANTPWEMLEGPNSFSLYASTSLILLYLMSVRGILHRREHHADAYSHTKNSADMENFLKIRSALAAKTVSSRTLIEMLKRFMSHPPISVRLDFLQGRGFLSKYSLIHYGVMAGAGYSLSLFCLGGGLNRLAFALDITGVSIIFLSSLCLIQYTKYFNFILFEERLISTAGKTFFLSGIFGVLYFSFAIVVMTENIDLNYWDGIELPSPSTQEWLLGGLAVTALSVLQLGVLISIFKRLLLRVTMFPLYLIIFLCSSYFFVGIFYFVGFELWGNSLGEVVSVLITLFIIGISPYLIAIVIEFIFSKIFSLFLELFGKKSNI